MIRRIIVLAPLLLGASAYAQQTRAGLQAQTNGILRSCGNGCITGGALNALIQNLIDGMAVQADANAFTKTPTAPTAPFGSNDTQLATTAYVLTAIGGGPPSSKAIITNTSASLVTDTGNSLVWGP